MFSEQQITYHTPSATKFPSHPIHFLSRLFAKQFHVTLCFRAKNETRNTKWISCCSNWLGHGFHWTLSVFALKPCYIEDQISALAWWRWKQFLSSFRSTKKKKKGKNYILGRYVMQQRVRIFKMAVFCVFFEKTSFYLVLDHFHMSRL